MLRRKGKGVFHPHLEEFVGHGFVAGVINLVDQNKQRFSRSAHLGDDFLILRSQTLLTIAHKQDEVGIGNRNIRLQFDLEFDFIVGGEIDSAGINHHEWFSKPLGPAEHPVSCHSRRIVYNRSAFFDDFVEQGGLADIGSSDDGDLGNGHGIISVSGG